MVWNLMVARVEVFHRCSQHVAIVVTESNDHTWLLSRVYASTNYKEQRKVWDEVTALVDQGVPIVVAGDFNCIDWPEDKRGGRPYIKDIGSREYGDFLQSNGSVDLRFVGPHFNWYNNHFGRARVWVRIDKFLTTPSWLQ